jgi:dTDP-4-amino-4,6-dideoxygalactose transaminase
MIGSLTIPFTGLTQQYNNLRAEVLDTIDAVLRSGQLMNGNYTVEFENWLARRNHSDYAVTCGSGTQALELLAHYYKESESHETPRVLIPSLTYCATANAFMRAGWDITFVDTDRNGLLDIRRIPDIDYDAVVMVGLYGAGIRDLASRYHRLRHRGRIIIEDAAQHWLSDNCVRSSNAAAISFDPTKNLANYGNGGAIITDSLTLVNFARQWRSNGHSDENTVGTNSRMSEIDCATLLIKSRYLDQWQLRRRDIAEYWMSRFRDRQIQCLVTPDNINSHCFQKFVIDVDCRDLVKQLLATHKIETKIHYASPLHEIGVYRQWEGPDMLAVSSALARRCLSLPMYPELSDLAVDYIADQVISCVDGANSQTAKTTRMCSED